ncbi:MAG: nucleotidyltransferase family protein [Candidatus Colwellbacteria bacterium]|nr:nucleotidyltransferase family protein [Candidatus Colwellbacteria bacterium]
MKAIILAAGEGRRMRPLTESIPKPLLQIQDKPLIEHIVLKLPKEIDELIIVVGYLGQMIQDYCGNNFLGRPVTYIEQSAALGTYHAISLAKDLLKEDERFFVLNGDEIQGKEGVKECFNYPRAIIVDEVDDPKPFGVVELDENGFVLDIIEKPEFPKTNLVNTGAYLLDSNIFKYPAEQHPNGEFYLPTVIGKMLKDYPVKAVHSTGWLTATKPDDLARIEKILANA